MVHAAVCACLCKVRQKPPKCLFLASKLHGSAATTAPNCIKRGCGAAGLNETCQCSCVRAGAPASWDNSVKHTRTQQTRRLCTRAVALHPARQRMALFVHAAEPNLSARPVRGCIHAPKLHYSVPQVRVRRARPAQRPTRMIWAVNPAGCEEHSREFHTVRQPKLENCAVAFLPAPFSSVSAQRAVARSKMLRPVCIH